MLTRRTDVAEVLLARKLQLCKIFPEAIELASVAQPIQQTCVRLSISREDSAATRLVPSSGRYDRKAGGGKLTLEQWPASDKVNSLHRWCAMSTVWTRQEHIMATQTCSSSA